MRQSVRDAFYDFNARFEGVVSWMYLDIKGLVTVGVGNLLPSAATAAALPFTHGTGGSAAGAGAKQAGWHAVHDRQDLASVGHTAFDTVCDLRLSDADVRALVGQKLSQNEALLVGTFPAFADWPADAQLGLLSMAWALGAGFPASWPKFRTACQSLDFDTAAAVCRMKEAGNPGVIPRNDADQLLFRNAAKVMKADNGYDPDTLYYPATNLDAVVVEGDPTDPDQ